MSLKHSYRRLVSFEFWPTWFFYAPFALQWLFYSIMRRSLSYFMLVNPGMRFGGLFQYSKYGILSQVAPEFCPQTRFYEVLPNNQRFYKDHFSFPFIYKPDIGERGKGVTLVRSDQDWDVLAATVEEPFMLQEYIDYHTEFGILYYRFPDGKSGISSMVAKGFLTITGDGKHTLRELIEIDLRASPRLEFLAEKFENRINEVIPANEVLLMEEIGNHCRGTTFYNANHLINNKLVAVFDEIADSLDGFYYGRFDLRVRSVDDLYQGKHIKIVEVNGVNSEAAHIYDPDYSLWEAYKDVFRHLQIVYRITKQTKSFAKPISYKELASAAKTHFFED